jgi:hypothetical protein
VGDKCWLYLQNECLTRTHQKLCPLHYGPYTITKAMGDNYFEVNIPPFLILHPMFNVELHQPYFPPLLDTSKIEEQLTLTELKPVCMEHASTNHIMDREVKGNLQQNIQLYRVVKARKLLHQGKSGPNTIKVFSYDGETQGNGDHCFLRRQDWCRWISMDTHLFHLAHLQLSS